VIVGGKLRGVGAPGEMVDIKSQGMEIAFELDTPTERLPLLGKAAKTGSVYRVQLPETELYASLDELRAAGARIISVVQIKATLEDFFVNLVDADRVQASAIEVTGK
jgi:hypothetical protein